MVKRVSCSRELNDYFSTNESESYEKIASEKMGEYNVTNIRRFRDIKTSNVLRKLNIMASPCFSMELHSFDIIRSLTGIDRAKF